MISDLTLRSNLLVLISDLLQTDINMVLNVTLLRAEFCKLSFVITQNSNTYEKQTYKI